MTPEDAAAARADATTEAAEAATDTAELGGDAACWARRVCAECGRLNEAEQPTVCEACGAAFD